MRSVRARSASRPAGLLRHLSRSFVVVFQDHKARSEKLLGTLRSLRSQAKSERKEEKSDAKADDTPVEVHCQVFIV